MLMLHSPLPHVTPLQGLPYLNDQLERLDSVRRCISIRSIHPDQGRRGQPSMPPTALHRALPELAAADGITLRIAGGCMAPAIRNGARVRVAAQRLYWPGDVLVFFAADGRLTAHRLIGAGPWRGRWRLFTRADQATRADTAILPSAVVGRVVGGDCAAEIARVPLTHRTRAIARFARHAAQRVLGRRAQGRAQG